MWWQFLELCFPTPQSNNIARLMPIGVCKRGTYECLCMSDLQQTCQCHHLGSCDYGNHRELHSRHMVPVIFRAKHQILFCYCFDGELDFGSINLVRSVPAWSHYCNLIMLWHVHVVGGENLVLIWNICNNACYKMWKVSDAYCKSFICLE